jgi:3-hydroxybutyryl-CoA dehydrogenase
MIKSLGIIGAGTMGTAIAELAALAKIDVQLYDVNETILRRSLERIKANLRKMVNLGQMTQEDFLETINRFRTRTNLPDLGGCDFIIEAIIEDLRVKKDLFKHLDLNTKNTAILASTTASLSITALSSLARNPERIIGTHFFNPVSTTSLVEVIRGHKTHTDTVEQTIQFLSILGKTCVPVKDTPGFVAGRIAMQYQNEALRVLGEHGADAQQIDSIMKTMCGFSFGPFEFLDQTGIDAALAVSESLYNQSYHEPRFRPHPILKHMTESNQLGKKTGNGFYSYEETK